MASAVALFVIAAFLSGAVTAVFAMLVVGVHAGDHPRHLTAAPPRGRLEALTRTVLGVGVRTGDDTEDLPMRTPSQFPAAMPSRSGFRGPQPRRNSSFPAKGMVAP